VDLEALPSGSELPVAILGQDPRSATTGKGQAVIERAIGAWSGWINRLLSEDDPQPLYDLYSERRSSYQSYVEQYYDGSWDKALQTWWTEHLG